MSASGIWLVGPGGRERGLALDLPALLELAGDVTARAVVLDGADPVGLHGREELRVGEVRRRRAALRQALVDEERGDEEPEEDPRQPARPRVRRPRRNRRARRTAGRLRGAPAVVVVGTHGAPKRIRVGFMLRRVPQGNGSDPQPNLRTNDSSVPLIDGVAATAAAPPTAGATPPGSRAGSPPNRAALRVGSRRCGPRLRARDARWRDRRDDRDRGVGHEERGRQDPGDGAGARRRGRRSVRRLAGLDVRGEPEQGIRQPPGRLRLCSSTSRATGR